jgi:hypothetical protein
MCRPFRRRTGTILKANFRWRCFCYRHPVSRAPSRGFDIDQDLPVGNFKKMSMA